MNERLKGDTEHSLSRVLVIGNVVRVLGKSPPSISTLFGAVRSNLCKGRKKGGVRCRYRQPHSQWAELLLEPSSGLARKQRLLSRQASRETWQI